MASTTKTTTLDLPLDAARERVRAAAERLTQYDWDGEKDGALTWERGFGLTNPQWVKATLESDGETTRVTYEVRIMALMDPFGFTEESVDRFIAELHAHHANQTEGVALPEVPPDKRGKTILIGSLAVAGLFVVCSGVIVVVAALS